MVGLLDGDALGATTGASVGPCVWPSTGVPVGRADEGEWVGTAVALVGNADGDLLVVGRCVGRSVG